MYRLVGVQYGEVYSFEVYVVHTIQGNLDENNTLIDNTRGVATNFDLVRPVVADLEILKGGFDTQRTAEGGVQSRKVAISAFHAKRGNFFLRVLFSDQEALS